MVFKKQKSVTAAIHFLKPSPDFSNTKPYAFKYGLESEGIPQTNMEMEEVKDISVFDMRGNEGSFTLETHGFEIIRLQSRLTYNDFFHTSRLPTYFQELEVLLGQRLGASEAKVFRHGIRKRHPTFPISTGRGYSYDQPTSVAHIDTTPGEMLNEVQRQFGAKERNGKVEWINVWKPLRGPLNDWPLVLCDGSSVNRASDLEAADLLYPDLVTENFQVYHCKTHRWYYLSNHQPDEIIVFRQASTSPKRPLGKYRTKNNFLFTVC